MHQRLPPLAAITLNASTSVETSLFNIDHSTHHQQLRGEPEIPTSQYQDQSC